MKEGHTKIGQVDNSMQRQILWISNTYKLLSILSICRTLAQGTALLEDPK